MTEKWLRTRLLWFRFGQSYSFNGRQLYVLSFCAHLNCRLRNTFWQELWVVVTTRELRFSFFWPNSPKFFKEWKKWSYARYFWLRDGHDVHGEEMWKNFPATSFPLAQIFDRVIFLQTKNRVIIFLSTHLWKCLSMSAWAESMFQKCRYNEKMSSLST